MSTRKAAVICISSCLGSVQSTMQTYEYFSAVPYRISKVGATFLTHYWSGTSHPPFFTACLLFFFLSLTWLSAAASSVCSEHAHHVCCNRAQEGRDLVFFAAPWLGADRHGWRERESQLKSNNNLQNLEVSCTYHQTPGVTAQEQSPLCSKALVLVTFASILYSSRSNFSETFYLNVIIFLYNCPTCVDDYRKLWLLFSPSLLWQAALKISECPSYSSLNSVWSAFYKSKQ